MVYKSQVRPLCEIKSKLVREEVKNSLNKANWTSWNRVFGEHFVSNTAVRTDWNNLGIYKKSIKNVRQYKMPIFQELFRNEWLHILPDICFSDDCSTFLKYNVNKQYCRYWCYVLMFWGGIQKVIKNTMCEMVLLEMSLLSFSYWRIFDRPCVPYSLKRQCGIFIYSELETQINSDGNFIL